MARRSADGLGADQRVLLGRYRLGEAIGAGGHSLVFRAEDERLRRAACVKLLRNPVVDPAFRAAVEEKFVQEAYLLAALTHPAILRIFDFGYVRAQVESGAVEEVPFQVTELVGGGTLSRWVRARGRLAPGEALGLIAPLARALAEVHARGVAHLDVRPQNILLSPGAAGPEAKLVDFGIAEAAHGPAAAAARRLLFYSVNWAAPEQMVGDPVSPASDVYALALVAAYALTGRMVFSETEPTTAYQRRKHNDAAIFAAFAAAGLPDAVAELIAHATHFDPAGRIGDVMKFLAGLTDALPSELLHTRPMYAPSEIETTAIDPTPTPQRGPITLWEVTPDQPCPAVAGRQLNLLRVAGSAAVEIERLRLSVTFVPAPGGGARLHIKGLNCFLAEADRRPSSAVTIDADTRLAFISSGGHKLAEAQASFGAAGPRRSMVSLADQSLVIAAADCRRVVALDFGAGQTCALLCEAS